MIMNRLHHDDEDGFTLIELLVVIIIIGILAAIAIPTFLVQRKKGYDAEVKSDLRNAATAEETYLNDFFRYTNDPTELVNEGWKPSSGNTSLLVISLTNNTVNDAAGSYCVSETSRSGKTWYYNSAGGGVSATACS